MTQIADALARLSRDVTELQQTLLSGTIDPVPYLQDLTRTIQTLEAKFERVSVPKPPLDPEAVWLRWQSVRHDLSMLDAREVRTLCVSPKTAMNRALVDALASKPDALMRWSTFYGFVQAYFVHWRGMAEPQSVEKLIQGMLVKGRLPRTSKVLDLWRRSQFLFSREAAQRLGGIVARDRKAVTQACSEHYVEPSSALAAAAHEQATALSVAELIQRDQRIGQELALKELQWISGTLLTKGLSPTVYREAMGKLIVSRLADESPPFQSALVSLVHSDERLGDPRVAYCAPNWRTMPNDAKEKLLAWLAKETLQFFFDTLVPKNDKNRRRAEFWLDYAKKQGKIKDFQVAVSTEDLPKIRASRAKTIPRYSTITYGNTSAFLMIFEGYGKEYVVIEFSETNNAAYIYERKVFEASGTSMHANSYDMAKDLKRKEDVHGRILHMEGRDLWETKARRSLGEMGIRP
jgi:hypothetical protein